MEKPAETAFPIDALLADRWSPRAFADRSVSPEVLGGLLEAARWAPSCFNAQPWNWLVARREDAAGFERMGSVLMEGNAWAKHAPLLLMSVARSDFEHNGKPNRHAWHDVGLANMSLVIQAQSAGLVVHQMAGFDADAAKEVLGIPAGHEPVAMLAIGYAGEADQLDDALAERERAPRARKALTEITFGSAWGESLGLS